MSDVIGLKEKEFNASIQKIKDKVGKIHESELEAPETLTVSEALKDYLDMMKKVQKEVNSYEAFVKSDMDRIQKLMSQLKEQDELVCLVTIQ